ncbi:MAG TPA: hypothetical protein ENJ35_01500 [Gammaproteobacteria bacterium]|nr:hypothetical protein [Gammaproteobacteria bacterium]
MAKRNTISLHFQVIGSVVITLLLIAAFWFFYVRLIQPPKHALVIDSMRFVNGDIQSVRGINQQRVLPDDWIKSGESIISGKYDATFYLDRGMANSIDLLGIYIPVIYMDAEVYLNGRKIGVARANADAKNVVDPLAREIYRPFYASFGSDRVRPGNNSLRIYVAAYQPGNGLLGLIYIGEDRQLRPYYSNRLSARVTTVQTISASMLTIAIFMTVLWWLRRKDSIYVWFALIVYAWAARNLLLIGYDTFLPAAVEDWLTLILLGWFITFMVICTHRYMDLQKEWMEYSLFAAVILGSLVLAMAFTWQIQVLLMHRIWSTFFLLLGIYALGQVAMGYRDKDDLKNPFVPAGGISILLLGIHDWLVIMGFVPRDNGLLLHFSAPVTLITFASLLLERFARVLRDAESLNLQLETRVAEKHAELEANYKTLRKMENQQILAEERERFMKEMHDGLGGHLISMLSMMRNGEKDTVKITRAIEASLSDLRIMIDSLDPDEHDIPALLGAMRSRLEPQLVSSGLKIEWQVQEIPPLPDFGPRKALQVMRIVQEAITNVLNHADATLIRIHARVEIDANGKRNAVIKVIDDGKGLPHDADRGHGLNNMEQRARCINASLVISARQPGTCVQLRLLYS